MTGSVHPSAMQMQRALLWSLPVALRFTFIAALSGLAQTAQIDLQDYQGWYVPTGLEHPRRFLCAQNAAYIGAAVAIPLLWVFHL